MSLHTLDSILLAAMPEERRERGYSLSCFLENYELMQRTRTGCQLSLLKYLLPYSFHQGGWRYVGLGEMLDKV